MSTLASLRETYGGFEQPVFRLELSGTALPQNREQIRVLELEASLSVEGEASAVKLQAEIIKPESPDGKAWLSSLSLGAKAELYLGYGKADQKVFSGLLNSVFYQMVEGKTDVLLMEAACLDVKALMMAGGYVHFSGQKKAGAVVEEILSRPQYKDFIGKKSVTVPPASWNLPLLLSQGNDYEVLRALSDSLCYEFYLAGSTLYFGKPRAIAAPTVEFEGMEGILSLSRGAELSGQTQKYIVTGFDEKGERVVFSKERPKEQGIASKKLASVLVGSAAFCLESRVRTMEQAKYLAEARMGQIAAGYGTLEGVCCGLPEILPGRFITIKDTREQFNGSFYVQKVTHTLDEEGFTTVFRAQG